MVLFTGCQKEYVKINEPDKKVTISPGDTIADLIRKVTLKDGSFDNIIDGCSAISIKFPYNIQVNDQLVQINSLGDIEAIIQGSIQYEDDFELIFPVTILYSDYSELTLNSEDDLEALQVRYNANLNDDDIECLDFVYPIDLCTYNTMFQNANCITAENDFDLYNLFNDLTDLVVEIEYPIEVKTSDNFTFTISDNTELEDQINNYINSCDENDEVEFNEDNDSTDSSSVEISDTSLITSGEWTITLFADETEDTEDTVSFSSYLIKFNPDFTVQAVSGTETIDGIWDFRVYDNLKTILIEFNSDESLLEDLNDEWEILVLTNDTIELQAESDSDGLYKKLSLSKSD